MQPSQSTSQAFQFLGQNNHEKIIFGVLKKYHLNQQRADYDDLVQEARLAFVAAYVKYVNDSDHPKMPLKLFIYVRVKWRILELLKRQQAQASHASFSFDNQQLSTDVIEPLLLTFSNHETITTNIFTHDLLNQLWQTCTQIERQYLWGAVHGLSNLEIANQYGVSKQAVSKWKRAVIRKAIHLK